MRCEGVVLIWDGSDWVGSGIDASALQNLDSVGINTTADATNRLAVSSDATLLSHAGSDHRVVVNKDGETDTASLLFQTGYFGRAEMGTAGSDDLAVKVSADAATWNTGVSFNAATGRANFPSGAQVSNRIDFGGRWYCYFDNRWVTFSTATVPRVKIIHRIVKQALSRLSLGQTLARSFQKTHRFNGLGLGYV